jgi:hypothetical protein
MLAHAVKTLVCWLHAARIVLARSGVFAMDRERTNPRANRPITASIERGRRVASRWVARGVLLASLAASAIAHGQTALFYTKPTAAQQAETQSWGSKFVTFKNTGTPASGASTFAFTAPAMNSPLFSPLAAANNTVSLATGSSGCGNVAPAPGDNVAVFLTSSAISTNLITEPAESEALIEAILADPSAEASIEGDELIGSQLTALPVSGSPAAPTFANASAVTMTWIAELAELSSGWAANLNPTDDARRRLLGQPRTVDQLQSQVNAFAASRGLDITTYQVEARFGLYGALPIVVAVYTQTPDSGFLLIDGVNGAVDGPFASWTAINPASLLSGHSSAFVVGSSVSVINANTGECAVLAKKWHDDPPSPGIWTPAPGTPTNPAPGVWQPWTCTPVAGGTCKCTSTGEDSDKTTPAPTPARPNTPVRILCTGCPQSSPGECATPAPATPATPAPHPVPPAAPQVPTPAAGCDCKKQWEY